MDRRLRLVNAGGSDGFDSRAWTGPGLEPSKPDAGGARAAFARAGGAAALRPQRASRLVVAIGFALILASTLLRPSGLDPWPIPAFVLDRLREAWITSGFDTFFPSLPDMATGTGSRAGLLGLALSASLCGIGIAWLSRGALAKGFQAAEAPERDAVYVTHRVDLLAPVFCFCVLASPTEAPGLSLMFLVPMGLLASFTARAITAVAERRFAGLGSRSAKASLWDLASLGLSVCALAAALARVLAS